MARGTATLKGRFHGIQLSAALKPREVKRVLALLGQIDATLRRAKRVRPGPGDDIFRWTSVFVPLVRAQRGDRGRVRAQRGDREKERRRP